MRVLIFNGSPRPKGNTKQMIQAFCEDNGINTDGCITKTEFVDVITRGGKTHPPDTEGEAKE